MHARLDQTDGGGSAFLHASASCAADGLDGSRARPNLWDGKFRVSQGWASFSKGLSQVWGFKKKH